MVGIMNVQQERGRRRPGCIARLMLILVGLAISLVVSEGLCKWLDIRNTRLKQKVTARISRPGTIPGVRFELIPGASSVTPGMDVEIRVNNLGFRGPDVSTDKPEGRFRIVVLGDSIAFGRPYPEEVTFPRQLETILRARWPGRDIEVINAALSGRDTWEETAVLEHRVLPLAPDLVILQICLNDHVRLAPPERVLGMGAFGERSWYSYSSLLKLLDERVKGFRKIHLGALKAVGLHNPTRNEFMASEMVTVQQLSNVEPNWDAWSRELLRFYNLARAGGAQALFVVFPTDYRMKSGDFETLPQLSAFAREHQIPLLDMIVFFGTDTAKFLRDYTHPTPLGHRMAAQEIAAVINRAMPAAAGNPPAAVDGHDAGDEKGTR